MHVEKLISSLLVVIPSPGESSLLQLPGPVLMQRHWKHIVMVLFPASDDPLLSCCIALFNFLLFILSCQYTNMHHVSLHGSPPICSWISRLSAAAQRYFHLWIMHGVVPSQRTASIMLIALSSGQAYAAWISLSVTLKGAVLGPVSTARQHLSHLRYSRQPSPAAANLTTCRVSCLRS